MDKPKRIGPHGRIDPAARFWAKVRKTDGCWWWTGGTQKGYGKFFAGPDIGDIRAHRFALMLHLGIRDIPPGKDVCHHCDEPACVRPDHLFLGTRSENVRDMVRKGRHWKHNRNKETGT